MAGFNKWLDLLIEEKGYDREQIFEVNGKGGMNFIPLEVVIEQMKAAPKREQDQIKNMVVRIDFMNGDILNYFKHLAKALAI